MPMRRLFTLLLFVLLCAAGTAARADDVYTFAGNTVNGCTLAGKTYTCPALPLPKEYDKVVIGGGYTVTANGDVSFGYNQSLAISGGGILKISGNLDIGNIQPSLLQVNGATLIAGKTFSIGAQAQTIVADIKAAAMNLGTGSPTKITGTVTATGPVNIASYTTIVGAVSGTTIVTNSPVTLTGDVSATTSLYLASYATVNGNIVAPALTTGAPVTVNGNVTATQRFQLASGSAVTGNVTAGELTLDASEAIITGNASVTHATLEWHGRVTDTITCTGGTKPGQCDCVTNNSGYDIRKNAKSDANGPYCEGKAQPQPPAPVLDHFLITHPKTASVCAPASVTVAACANASCSTLYTGGVNVVLKPSGQSFPIGANGSLTADVTMMPEGTKVLALDRSGVAQAATCQYSDGSSSAKCTMEVSKAGFEVTVPDSAITAGDAKSPATMTVRALTFDGGKCVPLFVGKKDVAFAFTRSDPAGGSAIALVGGYPAPTSLNLQFDADGKASTTLSYPDAGKIAISASATATTANGQAQVVGGLDVVSAPATFKIAVVAPTGALPAGIFAGDAFQVNVTAVNSAGATTKNFGLEKSPQIVQLSPSLCRPAKGSLPFAIVATPTAGKDGVESFQARMDDVGAIDLAASLSDGYMTSNKKPTGSTNTAAPACSGSAATFIPAYFDVTMDDKWLRTAVKSGKPLQQFYSGEPGITLAVTGKNRAGTTTTNYIGAAARDVDLVAIDADAVPAATTATPAGALYSTKLCASKTQHLLCAEDFKTGGTATWSSGTFRFAALTAAPLTAMLRATDQDKASSSYAPAEPRIVVRTGRARLSTTFGKAQQVRMPVSIDYWTGAYWALNIEDSTSIFPASAFALPNGITPAMDPITNGKGMLTLTAPAGAKTFSAMVALNLRSPTPAKLDDACNGVAAKPNSTGAGKDFLRAADAACANTDPHDPWARASFGVFSPETRRIIHVREVFR